jgi:lipopolysaccharide transport system ATP-binding protein
VRVRTEDSHITDAVDIRRPVGIEMEYEVLKPGYAMFSNFQFFNDEGTHVFSAHDVNPVWRRRPRPVGHWTSKAWIPGNFLSEGTIFVGAGLVTLDPGIEQFYVHDAVAFRLIDSLDGDSARGDYAGPMTGVVRPLLQWSTHLNADVEATP